eukprot:COSAG06_NODE_14733_length_1130_cov_1.387003_1_plen_151_part_00
MKRHFVRHFILKLNILPRQARDKHRKSTQKKRSVANKPSDSMVMQRTGLEFRRYGAAPEKHNTHSRKFEPDTYIYPLFCLCFSSNMLVSVLVAICTDARTCSRAQSSQDQDPLRPQRCPRARRLGYRRDSSLEQCASRPSPAKHSDHSVN